MVIIIPSYCYFVIIEFSPSASTACVGIEIAPQTNNTLAGEDAKYLTLVWSEFCAKFRLARSTGQQGHCSKRIYTHLMEHPCRMLPGQCA
jgi:hypothetical protein